MIDPNKIITIAQRQEQLIESGKQTAYNTFWDLYQNNGERSDYSNAFGGVGWTNGTFKPKYDMRPSYAYMMFRSSQVSGDLVEYLENLGVTLDFSRCTNHYYAFCEARKITRVGVIDLSKSTSNSSANNLFYYCTSLKTIESIILPTIALRWSSTFDNCKALENLTIQGKIQYNFNVQSCPLTHDSLMSIINALGDGLSYTLTIGATNLAKLSEEEILIAENKGWTVT